MELVPMARRRDGKDGTDVAPLLTAAGRAASRHGSLRSVVWRDGQIVCRYASLPFGNDGACAEQYSTASHSDVRPRQHPASARSVASRRKGGPICRQHIVNDRQDDATASSASSSRSSRLSSSPQSTVSSSSTRPGWPSDSDETARPTAQYEQWQSSERSIDDDDRRMSRHFDRTRSAAPWSAAPFSLICGRCASGAQSSYKAIGKRRRSASDACVLLERCAPPPATEPNGCDAHDRPTPDCAALAQDQCQRRRRRRSDGADWQVVRPTSERRRGRRRQSGQSLLSFLDESAAPVVNRPLRAQAAGHPPPFTILSLPPIIHAVSGEPSETGKEDVADSTFHTAEETGDSSEANTSGSGMAEHGHGGGGGGDDGDRNGEGERQSSTSTSLGKAGDEFDGRRYHLRIVQQPTIGCAFGSNVLSRLAIAPPLIVQLRVTDVRGNDVEFDEEIPFLVCRVSLTTEQGRSADMISSFDPLDVPPNTITGPRRSAPGGQGSAAPITGPRQSAPGPQGRERPRTSAIGRLLPQRGAVSAAWQRRATMTAARQPGAVATTQATTSQSAASPVSMLYGTLVASPARLPDRKQRLRTFFIFPEISIRSRGRFCLDVSLMRLPSPNELAALAASSSVGEGGLSASSSSATITRRPLPTTTTTSTLATITTESFDIVLSSDYRAPHITDLTRHFAANGVGLLLPPGQLE